MRLLPSLVVVLLLSPLTGCVSMNTWRQQLRAADTHCMQPGRAWADTQQCLSHDGVVMQAQGRHHVSRRCESRWLHLVPECLEYAVYVDAEQRVTMSGFTSVIAR